MDDLASLDAYLYRRHDRPLVEPPPDRAAGGRDFRIEARDGVPLAATLFRAVPATGKDPVVIASATGVRRRYYAPFAAWLASRGHDVITFDYRGIGDSRDDGPAWSGAAMTGWAEQDLAAVLDHARTALGGGRVSVIGHSVGGQLLGLLPASSSPSAVVTVAAQSGDYRLWPAATRWSMALLWYGVVPGVTHAVGYLPGVLGIGEDLPPGVALEWARWCRTPGYIVGGDGAARREGFARLRTPLLAFGFEDDTYAPPPAVDALLSLYTNARITRRHVAKSEARVGHFGFFRERHRTLWAEAAAFLDVHARAGGAAA